MKSKKHREPPEFETIQAAIEGDAEAINQVLSYFQPFIKSECKREYKDDFGRVHYVTDEYTDGNIPFLFLILNALYLEN